MTWLDQAGTFVLASVVLFVPGAIAALTVRLRGFTALAAAAPLSLALLAAAALVDIVIPLSWGPRSWVIGVVLLTVAAFGLRVVTDRLIARGVVTPIAAAGRPRRLLRDALPFLVLGVVAVLSGTRLASAFGAPSHISQTFDNIYHLNAVRQMMDDGVIAPTRQLLPGFYPDLWHIVVSTVAEMSGAGVAASVNVVSILLGAVVWPISCLWLVRTIAGAHAGATVTAGALSIGMPAFPLLMLDFGVLYPNVLSISLLPSAIAAMILVAGIGRGHRPDAVVRWTLLLALVPTLALAHPSTLLAFLLPAFLIGFTGFSLWWRGEAAAERRPSRRRWALAALGATFVAGVAAFVVARPSQELAFWPPSATFRDAVIQVISGGLVWRPAAWVVVVAAAAGVLTVLFARRWRRQWWLVASMAGLIIVYVVCLSFPISGFRYALSGTWYQDIYRIAALFPAFVVPLGGLGVVGLVALTSRALVRDGFSERSTVPATVGAACAVLLLVLTQTGDALAAEVRSTAAVYRENDRSPLLTTDERALLERLSETVPAGDVIVGNPWTGTALSYALADRRALVPHLFQKLSPDMVIITEELDRAATDPHVCAALERTSTRWILDFGDTEIHDGDHSYPGLADIGSVARLVDREGDAALYEIVACD